MMAMLTEEEHRSRITAIHLTFTFLDVPNSFKRGFQRQLGPEHVGLEVIVSCMDGKKTFTLIYGS